MDLWSAYDGIANFENSMKEFEIVWIGESHIKFRLELRVEGNVVEGWERADEWLHFIEILQFDLFFLVEICFFCKTVSG